MLSQNTSEYIIRSSENIDRFIFFIRFLLFYLLSSRYTFNTLLLPTHTYHTHTHTHNENITHTYNMKTVPRKQSR